MSTEKAQEVLETAVQNQPKRGCRKGCLKGCLTLFLLVALPFYWFCLHTTPLEFSKETTYVTGPLTTDGKRIDYFRAMEERFYPPEMKTDDNGYRMIVRACGDLVKRDKTIYDHKTGKQEYKELDPEPFRLQVYEKLGLDPGFKPTLKIESPDTVLGKWFRESLQKKQDSDPPPVDPYEAYRNQDFWTFADFPMLETWLAENTAGIDLLGEAVRKPVFRIPFVRENENSPVMESISFVDVQVVREFARAVKGRACYRIGIGNIDGAIDDTITIYRLARHATKERFLINGLVGVAIEGVAVSIGIGANPDHPLTKEQLEKLQKEIDALPPRFTFNECLEAERFFTLANFQDMYWGNTSESPGVKLFPILCLSYDFNIALRRWNKMFDAVIDGTFDEDKYFKVSYNPFGYLTVRRRTENFCNKMSSLMLPAIQSGREAWRRCECTANLKRLTLALLLYEKEHGSMPDGDWREAIKPYLGEKPEQYFRCPSSKYKLDDDKTTYALIRRDRQAPLTPATLLLVEVDSPLKLTEGDGTIPPDPALFKSNHIGGYNASFRNGAVRFIAETSKPEYLQSLLDGTATEMP